MAETMQEWIRDARIYCQESLDDRDFRKLDAHPQREKVYRTIASEGKAVYDHMKEWIEKPENAAADTMIPFDMSRESMYAALGREMDRLFPGWRSRGQRDLTFEDLLAAVDPEMLK